MNVYNRLGENILNVIDQKLTKGDHTFQLSLGNIPSRNYLLSYQTNKINQTLKMQYIK